MDVPVNESAPARYYRYWTIAAIVAAVWGVVIEGTLLSIRREVGRAVPVPCGYVSGPSFSSVLVRAEGRETPRLLHEDGAW